MVSTGVSCLFYINIHVRQLVINKEINMTVIIYHPMSCPLLSISWNLSTHFAVVYSCFSCSFSRSRSQINNTLKKKSSFLVFLPARLAPFTQPPICCQLLASQPVQHQLPLRLSLNYVLQSHDRTTTGQVQIGDGECVEQCVEIETRE